MDQPRPTMAQEIAEAAMAFQQKTTGHAPRAITVVLGQDMLVITLHEALSPVEKDLSKSQTGAGQVQEFHRQLFASSSPRLQKEIKRITGVEWREAVVEIEPMTGDMVQAFTRDGKVQVFRLAGGLPGSSWGGRVFGSR